MEGGINLFSYVANNPINRIDTLGLKWVFAGWDVENHEDYLAIPPQKYRILWAVCHDECEKRRLVLRRVMVYYQQWLPRPINTPEISFPIASKPTPVGSEAAREAANALADLIEAILKSKEGTEEHQFKKQMEQEGQKYCDQLN